LTYQLIVLDRPIVVSATTNELYTLPTSHHGPCLVFPHEAGVRMGLEVIALPKRDSLPVQLLARVTYANQPCNMDGIPHIPAGTPIATLIYLD
jgi:hypothetical protein